MGYACIFVTAVSVVNRCYRKYSDLPTFGLSDIGLPDFPHITPPVFFVTDVSGVYRCYRKYSNAHGIHPHIKNPHIRTSLTVFFVTDVSGVYKCYRKYSAR
ncbi:MAG: hypothetical protein ACXVJD_14715 [Mucilaginibacter sp.]